jgi:hypothetical protein
MIRLPPSLAPSAIAPRDRYELLGLRETGFAGG